MYNHSEIEKNTLNFLYQNDLNKQNFVFYDGPPFATGKPHYGH
jgi:isoleucyl-tRNA synthetase